MSFSRLFIRFTQVPSFRIEAFRARVQSTDFSRGSALENRVVEAQGTARLKSVLCTPALFISAPLSDPCVFARNAATRETHQTRLQALAVASQFACHHYGGA